MTTLIPALQRLARALYFSAGPNISPRNREFLQDFARGEARYQLVALQRLIMCARASCKPEDREALAEIIRAELLADEPTKCVATAFDYETTANGEANNAQRQFERTRCRSSWERARDALMQQYAATRASLDALASIRNWQ